jgi:D-alanyl-D-alanine carboxypeptidase (penicillin-binding protein 5/6)
MKKYAAIIITFVTVIFAGGFISVNAKTVSFPARSIIIMETSSNRTLFERNAYEKLPMASTTKIMTAITVLESCNPDEVVVIPKAACGIEGSSIYLEEGEKLTVKQLLYGLMLRSGNDCAVALALHAGGSVEKFADMMNEKAQMLECYDSHFVNPHGLHNKEHYTTAYDLAVISSYAMKNPIFREIVATKKIEIPCTTRNYGRILFNKNKMLTEYQGANGIKTGFTKQAGRCLVSSAVKNGMELICVVLNCGPMWEISKEYMDKMFSSYHMETFLQPFTYLGEIPVAKRKNVKAGCYSKDSFCYPVSEEDKAKIFSRIEVPDVLYPPFEKDSVIGKIKYYYDNQLIFSAKIYTIFGVDNLTYSEAVERILNGM